MASTSSSSGFEPKAPRKVDVFISFRGEDTRNNFTSHLHTALNGSCLEVFLDDKKLENGDEIAPSLIQAIKDSSVSVIVFSKDYASSKWCLDELDQIMQYRKDEGQFVIPIFYNVEPREVRNQIGAYKEAFKKHEKNYPDRVKRWRDALSEAGNLKGTHCQTSTDESKLIGEIVADVKAKLERIYDRQVTSKDVIGIDEMIKPIEELLEKSHKVGIWGMGGVGKTTMAKVVFDNLSSQYNHRWFLENVREETGKKGSKDVRDFLVSKLLGKDMQIDSSNEASVVGRLGRTKAFVVLDDVDATEQLENLLDNTCNFLGEGSKVIITTRDQKLLRGKGYKIHEAKGLSYENSHRLFIRKAFGSDNAEDGYEKLIEGFVDYTKHNPLALKVLGSYVYSEDKTWWGNLLEDLRAGNPHDQIQKVLRLSYDILQVKVQQSFLDIACFLKGESEEFVEELLKSYDFYTATGMQTLKDKALIDTTSGKVEMHDLIQEMGRQIVREENMNEPGKRSRLWDHREICDILKNCEGEKEVEGIMLDTFTDENRGALELTAKTFNKMTRLRFFKVGFLGSRMIDVKSIPSSLESISTRIRYFHWEGCPMKSLPSNFCAKHLVELNLRYGKVETLWEGVQDLPNLRRLHLEGCKNLRDLPDLSKACKLESVDLSGCNSLCYVNASLRFLHSLISCCCISIESTTARGLESFTRIRYFCWRGYLMKSLPSNFCIEHLVELSLGYSLVETLWEGVQVLPNLRRLDLSWCLKLRELPDFSKACRLESINLYGCESLCYVHLSPCLQSLNDLDVRLCFNIKEFSVSSEELTSLDLSFTKIEELSPSIGCCSRLQSLDLSYCPALRSLPKLPPSLRILKATDCTSLETVSPSTISSTPQNKGKKAFLFKNSVKLDLGAIEEQVKLLLEKAVDEKEHVRVSYPGKKVPEWFGNNRNQNDSDTLKLCLSSHTLVGFVFCAVAPDFQPTTYWGLVIAFSVDEGEMTEKVVEFPEWGYFTDGNVLLLSYPKASELVLEKIEGKRRNHDATTYNPLLSFDLHFNGQVPYCPTEEFGVYPIYASGELNSNSRKRKAIMI